MENDVKGIGRVNFCARSNIHYSHYFSFSKKRCTYILHTHTLKHLWCGSMLHLEKRSSECYLIHFYTCWVEWVILWHDEAIMWKRIHHPVRLECRDNGKCFRCVVWDIAHYLLFKRGVLVCCLDHLVIHIHMGHIAHTDIPLHQYIFIENMNVQNCI